MSAAGDKRVRSVGPVQEFGTHGSSVMLKNHVKERITEGLDF